VEHRLPRRRDQPPTRRGHPVADVDVARLSLYVRLTDERKADGIAALEQSRHPLAV